MTGPALMLPPPFTRYRSGRLTLNEIRALEGLPQIVTTDAPLTPEAIAQLRERWQALHGRDTATVGDWELLQGYPPEAPPPTLLDRLRAWWRREAGYAAISLVPPPPPRPKQNDPFPDTRPVWPDLYGEEGV